MNTNKKIIKICGEINEKSGFEIAEQIMSTFSDDSISTLVLLVASHGGNIDATVSILELLNMSQKEIISIGMQHVSSAATSIFMTGSRRILFPYTKFLIHEPRYNGRIIGEEQMNNALREMCESEFFIWGPIVENSDVTQEMIQKKCGNGRDWTLSVEEVEKLLEGRMSLHDVVCDKVKARQWLLEVMTEEIASQKECLKELKHYNKLVKKSIENGERFELWSEFCEGYVAEVEASNEFIGECLAMEAKLASRITSVTDDALQPQKTSRKRRFAKGTR